MCDVKCSWTTDIPFGVAKNVPIRRRGFHVTLVRSCEALQAAHVPVRSCPGSNSFCRGRPPQVGPSVQANLAA